MSGGQLQVRQASTLPAGPSAVKGEEARWLRWGAWTDVPSPGFLVGFILPGSGMVYEFRNAPEVADNG